MPPRQKQQRLFVNMPQRNLNMPLPPNARRPNSYGKLANFVVRPVIVRFFTKMVNAPYYYRTGYDESSHDAFVMVWLVNSSA